MAKIDTVATGQFTSADPNLSLKITCLVSGALSLPFGGSKDARVVSMGATGQVEYA